MNDVAAWMDEDCLARFRQLQTLAEETEGKGKGGAAKPADSAGKPGGKAGKHRGSAAKPAGPGPGQEAHLLKKQRFNKVINDIAANKAFFMSFIRHPCMRTVDGFELLLTELLDMKTRALTRRC